MPEWAGSGAIGDVFASILSKTDIHVSVVKGYVLPKTATKDTLVVTTSISGNTIETVTVLKEAMSRGCRIVRLFIRGSNTGCLHKKWLRVQKN